MEVTEKNTRSAKNITLVLVDSNCTVEEANEILSYVAHMIRITAKVQL